MTESIVFFKGEAQLLQWGDTSTRGRTITLQLAEEGDEHPFKHAQIRAGKTPGKRYMAVFVEIGDDERAVEKTASQLSYLWCQDPEFWHWCSQRSTVPVSNAADARAHVLSALSGALSPRPAVRSRGEIDAHPAVAAAWVHLFATPFKKYREAQSSVTL